MSTYQLQKTHLRFTALAGTMTGLLWFLASPNYPQNPEKTLINDLIKRLYSKVGGENRIQEKDEKRRALDELDFRDSVFDEAESLRFVPKKDSEGINLYVASGNFDRYIGTIDLKKAEDYLKNTENKKGKK